MDWIGTAVRAGEGVAWPDFMLRAVIAMLVGRTRRQLSRVSSDIDREFAQQMAQFPIAVNTDEANSQHYEVPPELFALMLGPQRKYSCCYYRTANVTLPEAEEAALSETAQHADLKEGQNILELGCGWGSFSLWMARRYRSSRITAVSNSNSQRGFIEEIARQEGLSNLTIITSDMNTFNTADRYDRVVSIEMFEHMSNWQVLLGRIASWLKPDGALFLHFFSHRAVPYRFDATNTNDWIAQHFFTGGIMPSHKLIRQFGDNWRVEGDWHWSGDHYRRTALDWLANFDRQKDAVGRVLNSAYGPDAELWRRRWRLFLLATSGLFGDSNGKEWGVSHYRLRPALTDAA